MGEMEEAVLQNSKGATYMSFVLDVEVILKTKKGTKRGNVAESKVKSESKVPKERGDKAGKPQEENKNVTTPKPEKKKNVTTPPPQKKEDLKIYTATIEPNNMFVEERKGLPVVKSSGPLKDQCSASVERSESVIASEVENRTKSQPRKHSIKKKMKKVDHKSKVFKGKIEKIDFLECNRIFMCNYFKIRNKLPSMRGNSQSESEPNTRSKTQVTDNNGPTLSSPKSIFTTVGTFMNNIKHSKLLNRRGTISFMVADIHQRSYATGDCTNINSNDRLRNLPVANLKTKDSTSLVSLNYLKTVNRSSRGHHKKYCCKRFTSCHNGFSNKEQFIHKTIIHRNKSLPNNHSMQVLRGNKISYDITKELSICYNLNKGKNKTSGESNKIKIISDDITYKELAGIEVKCVQDSQRLSCRPHIYRATRSKSPSFKHKLREATSTCEMSNVKQKFLVFRSKSLDHVQQSYKEYNSKQSETSEKNNHPTVPVIQDYDQKTISKNKPKKKRSLWEIVNSFIFECVMKKYD